MYCVVNGQMIYTGLPEPRWFEIVSAGLSEVCKGARSVWQVAD